LTNNTIPPSPLSGKKAIYKGQASKDSVENCRPTSVLLILSTIFEKHSHATLAKLGLKISSIQQLFNN
jgi:hypothetical protein